MINDALAWDVGRVILANIGMDPVIGLEENFMLSRNVIAHLHRRNLVDLQHIWKEDNGGLFHWCSAKDLQLSGVLGEEWSRYINGLIHAGSHFLIHHIN